MPDTPLLNKKVEELDEKDIKPTYQQSEKALKVVGNIYQLFSEAQFLRDQAFEYFDKRNLLQYTQDNVWSFNTNFNERDNIEDWQARIHAPFTRNKLIAILGRAARLIPKCQIMAEGDEDGRRSSMLSDLKVDADKRDNNDEIVFWSMLEALIKGTVIGYEGYEEKIRTIRDVDNYNDGDKLTIKKGSVKVRRLKGTIVRLEEFYPSSPSIRSIKEMPYCFWRQKMPATQFKMNFAQYERAKYVDGHRITNQTQQETSFSPLVSPDVREGEVELIRYYNQDTDEYVLIANGIWLNPLGKTEEVMPIPFKHKKLPFWSFIYEPIGSDFFYGKSMVDKLRTMQDVLDILYNMLLDQSFLTIFPPMLVQGSDGIQDDYLRPGRRIEVDDVNNYKELSMSTPNNWHQFILEFTKRTMEESAADSAGSTTAGQGDRVTAKDIEVAAQGVEAILGLFTKFIYWGLYDKDMLRAKNILQFYNMPLIEKVLGEGASHEFKEAFNTFKIGDTVLSSGKRGMKLIEFYRSDKEMPDVKSLRLKAKVMEAKSGKRVEVIAVNPEYLRDLEIDIRFVPNTSAEQNEEIKKAMVLEKEKVYASILGDMLDREESAMRIVEAFGDDPEKVLRKDLLHPEEKKNPMIGMGMGENNMPEPQQNITDQIMKKVNPTQKGVGLNQLASESM